MVHLRRQESTESKSQRRSWGVPSGRFETRRTGPNKCGIVYIITSLQRAFNFLVTRSDHDVCFRSPISSRLQLIRCCILKITTLLHALTYFLLILENPSTLINDICFNTASSSAAQGHKAYSMYRLALLLETPLPSSIKEPQQHHRACRKVVSVSCSHPRGQRRPAASLDYKEVQRCLFLRSP